MGVTRITVTEKLLPQRRFFCANCEREVFLQSKFCDKCGGEIDWPEKVKKVISSWKSQEKKQDKKH
jgi:rRNA maturation endonuclease Nob1